ncbi:hypothetical protein GQ54DRAFT_131738 [Martensiomyces pterosporus]|nr:hypothetical protein GQ54DRAFT_131738 [Martensiomyces pterosporus]
MGTFRKALTDSDKEWIRKQKVFFVASAPLDKSGHVNNSPKGYDCLRVLSSNRVIILDGRGSGCETIAHLRENKRVTLMFCAFEGPPRIMRLFGTGVVHEPGTAEFDSLFEEHYGEAWREQGKFNFVRSIIDINVHLVGQSCGYAVPYMEYKSDRNTLTDHCKSKSQEILASKAVSDNSCSLDGIPSYLKGTTHAGAWKRNRALRVLNDMAPWVGGAAVGAALATAVVRGALSK